jgi:hypothetical protein
VFRGGWLAAKAKRLTRELLEATTGLFTPDTVLGWYRKLSAQKYDGSENCENPGRPRISQEIIEPQHEGNQGEIICIERLGGLLKSYHRQAA